VELQRFKKPTLWNLTSETKLPVTSAECCLVFHCFSFTGGQKQKGIAHPLYKRESLKKRISLALFSTLFFKHSILVWLLDERKQGYLLGISKHNTATKLICIQKICNQVSSKKTKQFTEDNIQNYYQKERNVW